MNSLQITLIVIGLVIIGLVLLYNWWQDQQAQKRLNRHFNQSDSDPLLDGQENRPNPSVPLQSTPRAFNRDSDGPSLGDTHLDDDFGPAVSLGPTLDEISDDYQGSAQHTVTMGAQTDYVDGVAAQNAPATPVATAKPAREVSALASDEPGPDPMTEAVVDLRFDQPVRGRSIIEQVMRFPAADDKPIRYFAETEDGAYHAVIRPDVMYVALQIAVLMSNRSGPLQDVHWSAAMMIADEMVQQFDADLEAPAFKELEDHALDLDDLCASLDAQVGLSLLLEGPQPIKSVAEIARKRGFVDYRQTLAWLNNQGQVCFYMLFDGLALNQVESASVERIELLLDVPNSPADQHAFGKMVGAARDLAGLLRASIVDDQNQPLEHDELVASVDEQIYEIYQRLDQCGLTAGSERARRVFS
ncbi:MAG: cell division protein ZipA C-terminal FtsZ-binding domain-containing protein [Alcaligenaceae bacterium]|nr:cell division protein ZipA C-terminal FtsZ-binding domain-containing protein [Alcaligenaceae bacterium]